MVVILPPGYDSVNSPVFHNEVDAATHHFKVEIAHDKARAEVRFTEKRGRRTLNRSYLRAIPGDTSRESRNGFTDKELTKEVGKDLVKFAKQLGYTFFTS